MAQICSNHHWNSEFSPWKKVIFPSLSQFNPALHRLLHARVSRGLAVGASVGTMAGSVTGGAAGYQAYAKREQHLGRKKGDSHQQSMEISPGKMTFFFFFLPRWFDVDFMILYKMFFIYIYIFYQERKTMVIQHERGQYGRFSKHVELTMVAMI